MFLMLALPLVASAPPFPTQTLPSTGLEVIGVDFDSIGIGVDRQAVVQVLDVNGTAVTGADCIFNIWDVAKNGALIYTNTTPDIDGIDYSFAIGSTIYPHKGEYSRAIYCNTSDLGGLYKNSYYVTQNGDDPATDSFRIFVYTLFILSTLLLFYTLFITIAKLVTTEETIYDILLAWSSFILVIIVNYLSKEYLIRTFVENLTATFISVTAWTNVVLPLLAFIITMFVKSFKKKKLLGVNELGGFKH